MDWITLFGRLIHDHARFGLLTVKQIMEKSSDVGAIKLGLRVGNERFASYIDRMGFGKPTTIDLPAEERGLTKPASRWQKSSIGSIAMGQEIGVTPLQIIRMVSAVANGGILYRPYVVKTIEDAKGNVLNETAPRGERVISADTAAKLQDMLDSVITEGTATAGKLEGFTAADKTGTAQKIDETGHYSKTKFVASFAGFAPASNPVIAIIVVVDEPTGPHMGGEVAAPVFKKVAEPILRYLSVPPDAPSYAPQYTVKREQKQDKQLVSFSPSPSDSVAEFGEIAVPDFSGKSLREVTQDCLKAGLRLQSIGSGAAVEQVPPAGANVSAGTRIQVRFSSRASQR